MAKRKRLALPDPEGVVPAASPTAPARGQMAGAMPAAPRRAAPIADVAGEAAARAAMEEIVGEMTAARREGRLILSLQLEAVDEAHLIRDRVAVADDDQTALITSLRERGQQTPIEVVELGQGRYGLISGWRRLTALRTLFTETRDARFGTIQALVRPARSAPDAYIAMVEENEIRANLSFYERARIAARAAEQGAFATPRQAVKALFASASRAKRSKINSFLVLYKAFDGALQHPQAISERLGLALVQRLSEDSTWEAKAKVRLRASSATDADAELATLAGLLAGPSARAEGSQTPPDTSPAAQVPKAAAALMQARDGRIVLTGAALDAALAADLHIWLCERLGLPVEQA